MRLLNKRGEFSLRNKIAFFYGTLKEVKERERLLNAKFNSAILIVKRKNLVNSSLE